MSMHSTQEISSQTLNFPDFQVQSNELEACCFVPNEILRYRIKEQSF